MSNKRINPDTRRYPAAFTLVEIISVLVISSMVIMAAIGIYNKVKKTAELIKTNLDRGSLPREILQRLAEDLDRLAVPEYDTTLRVRNKYDQKYIITQLSIESTYYDFNQKPQTFEKVIWQTEYDPYEDALILYRSHSGLKLEDSIIDTQFIELNEQGKELFIPLCSGLTFFNIQALDGSQPLSAWTRPGLPKALVVTVSFASPVEDIDGSLYIPDEEKFMRTIAIDRTRKIAYKFVPRDFDLSELDLAADPNDLNLETGPAKTEPQQESEN